MSNPIQNAKIQQMIQSRPVGPVTKQPVAPQQTGTPTASEFDAVLSDRLKLSGHARTRLQSREIALEPAQWERVMDGVDRAAGKGAKDSLVLVDDVALVVSVKNRTVITAVEQSRLKENVFTNIDSAVIV